MDREALGVSFHWIRTWCQRSSKLSVYISSRCCRAWKQYMQPDIRPSGRGCVVLHVTETCSQPCGAKGAASKMSIYISSRCLRAWKQYMKSDIHAEGHLDVGLSSCSQPCGARGAAANASGAIRSNTWAATNLMLIGQSVPLMIKWRCCPELVQFHGFRSVEVLLDTPPGSPKNCPGGKGGSPDQSVPVIFKDSVVAGGRTIWCFLNLVPSGFKETPYSMDREHSERRGLGLWLSGYTDGVVTDSDPTVRGLSRGDPTVLWAAIVVILSRMMRRNTKSPFPAVVCCVVLECRRGLWNPRVLTLSPKSGLGTGLGLVCIWLLFPLLEARSWQEAKSNLVTVALGKDDRIAGCWTLGPPV
ncbi:hypothetical protein F2Q70_00012345 [Brassica cretica]|uniref:Uncharacterized protein n=1 Tax=Brassica cretica TaxID=69181 RepID=A0A8S9MFA2_BRACR|nr:hypothetical protein F2Q70_00012345 [Brassica cretica]